MQVPFDPGLRGWDALNLYRKAIGAEESVSGRHYANLIHLRRQVLGELWSAEAWIELGKGHLLRNELVPAVRAFTQALLIGTSDPDSLYLMGTALCELGEFERAEKALSQLVKAKPDHGPAHYMLAVVCNWRGRREQAAEAFVAAARLDPTNADAHYRLGNWFRDFGDFEEAASSYERALEVEPDHVAALFNLGCVLVRLGRTGQVRTVQERLQTLSAHLAGMLEKISDPEFDPATLRAPGVHHLRSGASS